MNGNATSIIRVSPGPLAEIASSIPNAPAATNEKINATTPTSDIVVFFRAAVFFFVSAAGKTPLP